MSFRIWTAGLLAVAAATLGINLSRAADGGAPGARLGATFEGAGPFAGLSYLVSGVRYLRYDWSAPQFDGQGSLPLFAFHLPAGFRDGVDAAVTGRGPFSGFTYFFKANRYVRYDWRSNRVDTGPAELGAAWGLPEPFASKIDVAFNGEGQFAHKLYLVSGSRYLRYDWDQAAVDSEALPLSAWGLSGALAQGLDTVVAEQGSQAGKTLLIRGDAVARYDWSTQTVDSGYPRALKDEWPALGTALEARPKRRVILFVSIDAFDPHRPDGSAGLHEPNLKRLREISAEYSDGFDVEDWWGKDLDEAVLNDPHVFALFGSGSFTEWSTYFRDPDWHAWLDRYGTLLKTTRVPTLAVCGSHQLLASLFAPDRWGSLGHMTGSPISEETDGYSRLPDPRVGEYGAYPIAAEPGDPLFEGLAGPLFFIESHADEVIDGQLGPEAHRIATADREHFASFEPGKATSDSVRSAVEAIRYSAGDRVLYSTQFHPELKAQEIGMSPMDPRAWAADQNGRVVLRNFIGLARRYWQ